MRKIKKKWMLQWEVLVMTLLLLPVILFGNPNTKDFQEVPSIRAGASTSNITPFLGDEIVGGFIPIPVTHIHDELYVRCLVLDDGKNKVAFGIIDNVFVKQEVLDSAKSVIFDRTGIPASHIMLSATHTHTATSAGGKGSKRVAWTLGEPFDEYQRLLIMRIADGIERAITNLRPAQISWGSTLAPEHVFNRRWFMKEGTLLTNPFGGRDQVKMNPGFMNPKLIKPAGPTDPEIIFFAVREIGGAPIAVLANYSLHYVGGIPSGHVSADYFGVFASKLEEMLRKEYPCQDFVAIMSNGTSGDVNNNNLLVPFKKHLPYQKMEEVSFDIAQKVFSSYQQLVFKDSVSLAVKQSMLNIEVRKPTSEMLHRAYNFSNIPKDSLYHPNEYLYAERMIEMAMNWPDSICIPIQVFRIGDLIVGGIPFEVFAETGLELKRLSPFEHTMIIGLANGGYGYLPTPQQHDLGGYETWLGTNRVEKQASVKIVDCILKNINELKSNL